MVQKSFGYRRSAPYNSSEPPTELTDATGSIDKGKGRQCTVTNVLEELCQTVDWKDSEKGAKNTCDEREFGEEHFLSQKEG